MPEYWHSFERFLQQQFGEAEQIATPYQTLSMSLKNTRSFYQCLATTRTQERRQHLANPLL
jgi:hypothetical protein